MLFGGFYESIKTILYRFGRSCTCFCAVTVAPQQTDASYGYKYTDSQRPPVSTPTGYVNPAMGSTVTVMRSSTYYK